jgi:hypothetical protein
MMNLPVLLRHPELVSGSTSPLAQAAIGAPWMLKQVQHDGLGKYLRGFVASCESNFLAQRHEGTKDFQKPALPFIFKPLRSGDIPHPNPSPEEKLLEDAVGLKGRLV